MTRFKITLNMPSRRGGPIHQILCEHSAETIEEFMAQWRDEGYVIVDEFYNQDDGSLKLNGQIAITDAIGAKVAYMDKE